MQARSNQVNEEFLRRLLAEGPLPAWYIMREAKEERHKQGLTGTASEAFTKRGIQKVRRHLKVKVQNEQGTIIWELPH